MKNVFTFALLLVAASILLFSCSQTSNTSLTKSHNQGAFYDEPDANRKSETMKVEMNTFQEKGYNSVQTDRKEVKNTLIEKNTLMSEQKPLLTASVSTNKEEQNNSVFNDYNSDVKGDNGNTEEVISEYQDNPNISESASNSNSSGHSSSGVPFWLIVVCSIIIPPLGVALMFGVGDKFWICLALTLCIWLPGMIYALIQVLK